MNPRDIGGSHQAVLGISVKPQRPLLFWWQEWQDSNLQPPVLETGALAIELHS
jgi:hypothetical protein